MLGQEHSLSHTLWLTDWSSYVKLSLDLFYHSTPTPPAPAQPGLHRVQPGWVQPGIFLSAVQAPNPQPDPEQNPAGSEPMKSQANLSPCHVPIPSSNFHTPTPCNPCSLLRIPVLWGLNFPKYIHPHPLDFSLAMPQTLAQAPVAQSIPVAMLVCKSFCLGCSEWVVGFKLWLPQVGSPVWLGSGIAGRNGHSRSGQS